MATEVQAQPLKAAAGGPEAEAFRKFVKRLVGKEAAAVLKSLDSEGAVIGKKQISRTVGK